MMTFLRKPALLASVSAVLFLLVALLVGPGILRWNLLDQQVYQRAANGVLAGGWPYRDFPLEYPPLALAAFLAPHALAFGQALGNDAYMFRFMLVQALILAAITGIGAALSQAVRGAETRWYFALAVIGALVLPWRYDLFPALLSAAAVLAVLHGRWMQAGAWLGLGIAAKLYPIVLLPVLALPLLVHHDRRGLVRLGAGAALALGVVFLPLALVDPLGWITFLTYHQLRGIQIESVAGSGFLLLHTAGVLPLSLVFNYGALHLEATGAASVARLLPLALIGGYLALLAAYWRGAASDMRHHGAVQTWRTLAAVLAALLVFMLTNKVFSPQYSAWLLPFIPLVARGPRRLLVAVCALTVTLFPLMYDALLAFAPSAVLVLVVRNALVVWACVWLVRSCAATEE